VGTTAAAHGGAVGSKDAALLEFYVDNAVVEAAKARKAWVRLLHLGATSGALKVTYAANSGDALHRSSFHSFKDVTNYRAIAALQEYTLHIDFAADKSKQLEHPRIVFQPQVAYTLVVYGAHATQLKTTYLIDHAKKHG